MCSWSVVADSKTGGFAYEVPSGLGHALLGQIIAGSFKALRVSASLCKPTLWWPIHLEPGVVPFELEHARDADRSAYNGKCLTQVRQTGKTVRGEHAGFSDFFVPVTLRGELAAFLVVGPFAMAQPTAEEVLARWRWLTGSQGHPSDPEFAAYLFATLATLVVDGGRMAKLEELLVCLARLIGGEGRADASANRADALRVELERVRVVEQQWDAVREMLDDRFSRTWQSPSRAFALQAFGLSRFPNCVLVGLTLGRTADQDPIDQAIRRNTFQRRSVELARGFGGGMAGRVGDQGVVFLLSVSGGEQRKRHRLLDLAHRVASLARRLGLSAHFGAQIADRSARLSRTYQAAVGAAESAVTQGARIRFAESDVDRSSQSLRRLRGAIDDVIDEQPDLLVTRFDRYLEAVALRCGYRTDTAQAHLEACFERLTEALVAAGRLDERSLRDMREALDRAADGARTVGELFSAYRSAVADVSATVGRPLAMRHDRNLRRAVDFIHAHYAEALSVDKVARIAGFAPNYFSKLFRAREGSTFAAYVSHLRVERAKQMLGGTRMSVARIADLCGFRSAEYFSRVFRRATGMAPLRYGLAAGRKIAGTS